MIFALLLIKIIFRGLKSAYLILMYTELVKGRKAVVLAGFFSGK
jgi:hypothetical protein